MHDTLTAGRTGRTAPCAEVRSVSVVHEALFFAGHDDLVDGTRDLIEGGLAAGDVILVHGDDRELGVLREAWNDDPAITFIDSSHLYRHAMETIGEFQRVLHRATAAGRTLRTTGTVPFRDGEHRSNLAWMRYEALIHRVFAPYSFRGLCRYDTGRTHETVLAHARATHDRIVSPAGDLAGHPAGEPVGDVERARILADLADLGGDDGLRSEPVIYQAELTVLADLRTLRAALAAAPEGLVLAANEIATNALEHGAAPVTVRVHRAGDRWLVAVTDHGPGLTDPYAGVDSPLLRAAEAHGRGLWLARQLVDHLAISHTPDGGTTVRVEVHTASR